ncbi:MAG: ASCH domain-containing protein [Candidatus Diapherotrites archaeon]|nr:ASCH domain-containing protein [Candidatus Diapherotrites archaeon]
MMLHFSPRYRKDLISGKKRMTIRYGRKYRVRPGNVVFLAVGNVPIARAKITSVQVKQLNRLTPQEIRMEGYRSFDDLLANLRKHYPEITPQSYVTVIKWALMP